MSDNKRGWTKGPDAHELYVDAMESNEQSSLAPARGSAVACERCKDTGIDQTEHCEGRLTGMTCDCPKGQAIMEKHYQEHPEDR